MKLDDETRARIAAVVGPLQPARHLAAVEQRARLVEQMRTARQDIAQIFIDCEHWNKHFRKPGEMLIDPDPNGDLRQLAAYYDRMLKNDTQ